MQSQSTKQLSLTKDAIKQRNHRAKKKKHVLTLNRMVEKEFPWDHLEILNQASIGNPDQDYGQTYWSLNFVHASDPNVKRGKVGGGIVYQNGHTFDRNFMHKGEVTSSTSKKLSEYIWFIFHSLQASQMVNHPLTYLRVQAIHGEHTRLHTDSFRGLTKSYVMFHHNDPYKCGLKIHNFPKFRTSVVKIKGHKFIPLGYSSNHGIRLIGLDGSLDSSIAAARYEFPPETLQFIEPLGELPFVVVGIKEDIRVCS